MFEQEYNHPKSELEPYEEKIVREFEARPSRSRREAAVRIEKMTGFSRSLPWVGEFLKENGLENRAVVFLPGKVDCGKQKTFLDDVLLPVIRLAELDKVDLFFMDASHFVMGGVSGRVWSRERVWADGSGRK